MIPNAVDVGAAPALGVHAASAPLIVAVGRLKAPKDFPTLVRALGRLRAGSFEAMIVGDGPDRPLAGGGDPARAGSRTPSGSRGERHDVPQLLAAADVFVLSSASEGMPVSVLEAMAAGLPVVASRSAACQSRSSTARRACSSSQGIPKALAAALERLTGRSGASAPARSRRPGARGGALRPRAVQARAPRALLPRARELAGCPLPCRSGGGDTPRGTAGACRGRRRASRGSRAGRRAGRSAAGAARDGLCRAS